MAAAVTEDVWSERDTTPDAIEAALRELLRERHAANEALAPARVLNLVVVVDRDWKGEIANRLQRVGRYHASRTVLCAVEEGRTTLDARAVMSYEEPCDGASSRRDAAKRSRSTWVPSTSRTWRRSSTRSSFRSSRRCCGRPTAMTRRSTRCSTVIDVVLLDSDDLLDPPEAFERALRAAALRLRRRSRLAADHAVARAAGGELRPTRTARRAARDVASSRSATAWGSEASALLLAGWLASRLGWHDGEVPIELEAVQQDAPGLAGVTVRCGDGFSLSLDRARGGLQAREQPGERSWRVLGASRGEAGILGEGVRQALLRDPTYGPALAAARRLCA